MRKILIVVAVALLIMGPGLTGCSRASEQNPGAPHMSPTANPLGDEKRDAAAAEKAEDAKKDAEAARKVVVARVNGSDISLYELIRAMNIVAPKYINRAEQATREMTSKIRKEALDRLIFEELAIQEAAKEGINPGPEAVENVVREVRKNLGTEEAYKDYLSRHDLTEEMLKKLIARSQSYEMITAKEIYRKVKVDERLLKDEYEKEKSTYVLPENFVAEDVFFPKGKDEETAKKRAGEILETIKQKKGDAWKLVLDGTFVVRQMRITRERNPEVYKAMAGMNVGDLSGVLTDRDGLHIVKVSRKDAPRQATFEEAKGAIEPKFLVPAQDKRKDEWEKELKKNARIEIVLAAP